MKIVEPIARFLDSITGGRFKATFREAAVVGDDDPNASEYRRLTSTKRDMMPLEYERAQKLSYDLWQRNPLARRLIRLLVDFCTGDEFGVTIKVKTEQGDGAAITDVEKSREAQAVWSRFVDDPVNNFLVRLPTFANDFFLNGELVLMAFPNIVPVKESGNGTAMLGDGAVRIGYIDPLNIKGVVHDGLNVLITKAIQCQVGNDATPIELKVINIDVDPNSATVGKRVGQVWYWKLNSVTNSTRGNGELVEVLDWIDLLDRFLFDALEGFKLRNSFFYDLMMKGKTDDELKEEQKKMTTPRPGSVRLRNENAEWQVITPDLKAQDVEKAMLAFEAFIVGAKGYPIMWFGQGGETNRATAGEMAIPTMRMLKAAQLQLKTVVKDVAYFVLDAAQIAGYLKLAPGQKIDCEVQMFDFERKESADVATAFVQTVQALTLSVDKGWVSEETAKKVIDGIIARLGIEIDEDETIEDLAAQKVVQGVKDIYSKVGKPGEGEAIPVATN